MKSRSSLAQLMPLATGSTHPRIEKDDVLDLMVPWLDDQDVAAQSIEHSQECYRLSAALVTAAKFLVEALIEKRIDEAALAEAQIALERSDESLDRRILERIAARGLDAENHRSIFSDLDSLYRALEHAAWQPTRQK